MLWRPRLHPPLWRGGRQHARPGRARAQGVGFCGGPLGSASASFAGVADCAALAGAFLAFLPVVFFRRLFARGLPP